jgi:hypothetical protein
MDQAKAMVERCHRLYLRTLGALQDLRRRSSCAGPVIFNC